MQLYDKQLIPHSSDHSKTLIKKPSNNISFDPSIKLIKNFPQTTVSKRVLLQSSTGSILKERSNTENNTNVMKKELKENVAKFHKQENWKMEMAKWHEFGHNLAESYDRLKQKYTQQIETEGKNAKIVNALKEELGKLTESLNNSKEENKKLKESMVELTKKNEELEKRLVIECEERSILENERELNTKLITQLNNKIKVLIISH
jgi:chromosome segregation ATPase